MESTREARGEREDSRDREDSAAASLQMYLHGIGLIICQLRP